MKGEGNRGKIRRRSQLEEDSDLATWKGLEKKKEFVMRGSVQGWVDVKKG